MFCNYILRLHELVQKDFLMGISIHKSKLNCGYLVLAEKENFLPSRFYYSLSVLQDKQHSARNRLSEVNILYYINFNYNISLHFDLKLPK